MYVGSNERSVCAPAHVVALAILDPLYRRIKSSSVSVLLDTAPVRLLRSWIVPGMAPNDVLRVIDTLTWGGVPCWLVGGWGVDALLYSPTRKHSDVDVAIDRSDEERALLALERDGFAVVKRYSLPAWMPRTVVLRDSRRSVDRVDAGRCASPRYREETRPPSMQFRYADDSFAEGMLDGRVVRCLSAQVQLLFHTGYPARMSDRHDVGYRTFRAASAGRLYVNGGAFVGGASRFVGSALLREL